MKTFKFISIDPGTSKCGVAVMDSSGAVLEKTVSPFVDFSSCVQALLESCKDISAVVVGAGTGSGPVVKKLKEIPGCPANIVTVRERNSTLEARKLYEKDHPRPWPLSMIPFGLFGLPEGMDAYAAVAIGLIYLEKYRENAQE